MDFICVELCMDFVWFLDLFMGVEERIKTEAICACVLVYVTIIGGVNLAEEHYNE